MHPMFYTANSGLCNYVLFLQIRSHFRSKNQCSDYFKLEKLVLGGMAFFIPVFGIPQYPVFHSILAVNTLLIDLITTLFVIYTTSKSCSWLTGYKYILLTATEIGLSLLLGWSCGHI